MELTNCAASTVTSSFWFPYFVWFHFLKDVPIDISKVREICPGLMINSECEVPFVSKKHTLGWFLGTRCMQRSGVFSTFIFKCDSNMFTISGVGGTFGFFFGTELFNNNLLLDGYNTLTSASGGNRAAKKRKSRRKVANNHGTSLMILI